MSFNFMHVRYAMEIPNQEIPLYEGEFYLRNEHVEFAVSGRVFVSWLPTHTIRFVGFINLGGHADLFALEIGATQLIIENDPIGFVRVRKCDDGSVEGSVFNGKPVGNVEEPVDEAVFALTNMKQMENRFEFLAHVSKL